MIIITITNIKTVRSAEYQAKYWRILFCAVDCTYFSLIVSLIKRRSIISKREAAISCRLVSVSVVILE